MPGSTAIALMVRPLFLIACRGWSASILRLAHFEMPGKGRAAFALARAARAN